MISKKKTLEMLDIIDEMFPDAECELVHDNPFELTIAVLLSAQCTDVLVNKVTKNLFQKYKTPEDYLSVTVEELMDDIRSITLSDLAQVLGLSTKQAGRLLMHYTGRTFRGELTRCRMEAARRMMAETNAPPLTVIAERVGYQSYSGFWKAFRGEK